MKQTKLFALCALAALAATACKEDVVLPDALTLSAIEIPVVAEGGSQTLTFTSNCDWTASSDAAFVTVSPESGVAGDATVTLAIAANDTFEERSATVSVVAGAITTTYKVKQAYVHVFGASTDAPLAISADAQTFAIAVTSNEAYEVAVEGDWLTYKASKAAPTTTTATFQATANAGIEVRKATITITSACGSTLVYAVEQAVAEGAMLASSVKYISNVEGTYNPETYAVSLHSEYVLEFNTEKGQLVLAINAPYAESPLAGVPTGEYEVDADGSHTPGTFSIAGVKYYSKVVENEREVAIADGLVSIEAEGDVYTVVAQVMDMAENITTYTYQGALPELEDASADCETMYISYVGDFYTYFASGAKGFSFSFYPARCAADENYVYAMGFTVYADKSLGVEIPTGKFTLDSEDVEVVNSGYANGNYNFKPGTISYGTAYSIYNIEEGQYFSLDVDDATIEITKDGNNYIYKIDAKFSGVIDEGEYDDDWNWVPNIIAETEFTYSKTFVIPAVEISDNASRPVPDGDATFSYAYPNANYMGYYYGKSYSTLDSHVWMVQWGGVEGNFTVNLPIISEEGAAWAFEKNFNNRFCNTPLVAGTYTFAAGYEPAAQAIGNWKTTSRAAYVKNGYTGTVTFVKGGTVTFSNGSAVFDLQCESTTGVKANFTGTLATTCYYLMDYTAASRQAQTTWAVDPNAQ